jgi:hypothetical protein
MEYENVYDYMFGSVVQFVPVDGFCNITVTNNLYKAKCNLTSQEFIVELQTAFQWYDGHDFKCVVQYGSVFVFVSSFHYLVMYMLYWSFYMD